MALKLPHADDLLTPDGKPSDSFYRYLEKLQKFSPILDDMLGNEWGTIAFRGEDGWTGLAPGTAGHRLQTNGTGADPTWAALPASAWQLIESRAASGADETFTNLGGYRDLWYLFDRTTTSSAGNRQLEVSTDSGSTWATVILAAQGSTSLANIIPISASASTATSISGKIMGWGTTLPVKPMLVSISNTGVALISASVFNAIRFSNSAGNLNGGTIHLFGIPS